MMLKDLLRKNRSYRGYDESVPVSHAMLEKWVEQMRYTPSSRNQQPLQFYLASEPEMVAKIQAETHWAALLPQITLPHEGKKPTAFVVICFNKELAPSVEPYRVDVGILAQSLLLAAVEDGFGGCMIGNFSPAKLHEVLMLPEHINPVLVIALGKPDEEIVITEPVNGNIDYYRDENDVHYVPKRTWKDLIIK